MRMLLVVDVQRDFCPGGALAVRDGAAIVPVINKYINTFVSYGDIVAYTKDWHPANHCSFAKHGGIWMEHCIQGTLGADFHQDLKIAGTIFHKGIHADREEYSALESRNSPLEGFIRGSGVSHVYVCGIATDYCVKAHARDLMNVGKRKKKLSVSVLTDAVAAVDAVAGDGERALTEMACMGVKVGTFSDIEMLLADHADAGAKG